MDLRVEDREQVSQSNSFGVKERPTKSGKPSWKVEFRSNLFGSNKIWVGSFKTQEQANKACDAALHYLHRPIHYYTYPSGHFDIEEIPQDEHNLRLRVQALAKKYAQRPLPIIATASTLVTSEDPAAALDHLALQNFRANADVSEVGGGHNSVTYGVSSPRVSASSPSPSLAWFSQFLLADNPDPEDRSLKASNDLEEPYLGHYHEFLACCGTAVGEGSSDVAIKSAIKEDFSGSIDSPLASVPRLQGHRRSHSPEFAKIEDTDQLPHAGMCKSTAD